jgi:hypothetical protein
MQNFMHTFEANLRLPDAQRQVEVAVSLAPAARSSFGIVAPDRVPTAVKPASWVETPADWLDTPAAHCSPLDDY